MEIMVPERLRPTDKDGTNCKCKDREHLLKYKKAVIHWLAAEGDTVAEGDPICELQIDKLIFTITAPITGVLKKKYIEDEETFSCKEAIGVME